ncbi:MAG TPA: lysophospholipase [Bdellovibrionota bacterium]|nr:lysophospholipase [Bdellovibrionota bacterium]
MPKGLSPHLGFVQPRGFPGLPEGWSSEWETFEGLFALLHHVDENAWTSPRALIVFHGLGEHGGRYLHFPHYFKDSVQAVYCVDFRGHGRSEGLRGHVDHFDVLVDDAILSIRRLDERLRKRFGKSELHVFAHSMGGMIALRAFHKDPKLPVKSASISSPLLGIRVEVPLAKRTAAHLLSKVWGSLQLSSELDPQTLSHDQAVSDAYIADRLVHRKLTPRFYAELLRAIADTAGFSGGITVPLQFLVAMQDKVIDSKLVLKFAKKLKSRDKEVKTYPEFFHEVVNEIGKEKVFEDIRAWITKHSATN